MCKKDGFNLRIILHKFNFAGTDSKSAFQPLSK